MSRVVVMIFHLNVHKICPAVLHWTDRETDSPFKETMQVYISVYMFYISVYKFHVCILYVLCMCVYVLYTFLCGSIYINTYIYICFYNCLQVLYMFLQDVSVWILSVWTILAHSKERNANTLILEFCIVLGFPTISHLKDECCDFQGQIQNLH